MALFFDPLFCYEEQQQTETFPTPSLLPILFLQDDLFLEDEHLVCLMSKETPIDLNLVNSGRRNAVEWMLRVSSHYGFSTHTAILSVNYLDRFLSHSNHLRHHEKPWMVHLAAVTCLSLAAKFEETHVPLLLDLQVEGTEYLFEAKTIQKMELLVLSILDWKMNPVTPVSFLDHITTRLGLEIHAESEFSRRCEELLVSVVPDWRFVGYLPSVVATAIMMHVIDQLNPSNPIDFHNHLLRLLNITKESVKHCYEAIVTVSKTRNQGRNKREREASPSGVLESYLLSSSESWGGSLSVSSSTSSSPEKKRQRVGDEYSGVRLLVGVIGVAVGIISYVVSWVMRHLMTEELLLIFPLLLWKRN